MLAKPLVDWEGENTFSICYPIDTLLVYPISVTNFCTLVG